ncbi:hypothetical protein AGLY_006453 [Aphis glycines]|uniref:Reverse transcriptase domain-containing protein n=1 Tax=Aphis glycines TaxID=307491 RepID=A0A6G0TR30_APHGL|nr:hypothetical protein AGLY_006453 [Aphis glycines]
MPETPPELKEITIDETIKAIYQLKNWKAPGQDRILEIHILCKRIWDEERLPDEWNKAIIILLYKKRDKILCNNYRGIALLNTTYQCEFRKSRFTIDQLSIIRQLMKKKHEFKSNFWQIFVDFKKASDSIYQDSLYNIMYELGFLKQIISLTRTCMNGTCRRRSRNCRPCKHSRWIQLYLQNTTSLINEAK